MKKVTKILVLILAIMLVISFAGCGEQNTPPEGKYLFTSMSEGEDKYNEEMLQLILGENYAEENFIEFLKDNTFTMTLMGTTVDGRFKQDGNNFTLSSTNEEFGDNLSANMDGDVFTIVIDETQVVFTKE